MKVKIPPKIDHGNCCSWSDANFNEGVSIMEIGKHVFIILVYCQIIKITLISCLHNFYHATEIAKSSIFANLKPH